MWPWSGPGRPASRLLSMRPPRACRCSRSISARSADRPEPLLGSRTISGFQPEFQGKRWPGAPSARRRSSAPSSASRWRWRGSIAVVASGVPEIRCACNSRTVAWCGREPWSSPPGCAIAGRISRTCRASRARASPTGRRRSRPSSARARRWRWSAAGTRRAKRLHLIVRGKGLEATMSRYLIDRIGALSNVDLHVGTEVVALEGDRTDGLHTAVFRDRTDGTTHACALRHLFLFIGADPNAAWLGDRIAVDDKGFVLTGRDFARGVDAVRRSALPLETSLPGVFAIGDVRAGSTKRVAAAVGEGAAVVAQIHTVLALEPEHA